MGGPFLSKRAIASSILFETSGVSGGLLSGLAYHETPRNGRHWLETNAFTLLAHDLVNGDARVGNSTDYNQAFPNIIKAVLDAAETGELIHTCAGTYPERVVVRGDRALDNPITQGKWRGSSDRCMKIVIYASAS